MNQNLFELIKSMTGRLCMEADLHEIIRVVKQMDAPDGWLW